MRHEKQSNMKTLWGGGNFLAPIFTYSNPVGANYTSSRCRR